MRVARQHPLHLQVTRTNNGKFLVNHNAGDIIGNNDRNGSVIGIGNNDDNRNVEHNQRQRQQQQQQQQQQEQQQPQQQHHQQEERNRESINGNSLQYQQIQNRSNNKTSEGLANVVSNAAFPTCESTVQTKHQGPKLLGERFLLCGPAEGSALHRCVDVKTGQQLVAKVSLYVFAY